MAVQFTPVTCFIWTSYSSSLQATLTSSSHPSLPLPLYRAVHTVDFSCDGLKVFSGSDDRTVVYWDMAEGRPASTLIGHQDYVRCGAVVPSTDSLFLSGSYDHTVRLWDTRSGNCVAVMDHGAPVECLLPFASGAAALSAGESLPHVNSPVASGPQLVSLFPM